MVVHVPQTEIFSQSNHGFIWIVTTCSHQKWFASIESWHVVCHILQEFFGDKFRKIFKTNDFGNNLWKYVFRNFKSKCQKNFWAEILRKYGIKFSLTFGKNLRIKGFENFEKIYTYSENLQKFLKNFETEYSVGIMKFLI